MFTRLVCRTALVAVVILAGSESQAARSYRRGRSHRSSPAARLQRYVRARQQQMRQAAQNYQRLMLQRQQALAKQRAEKLARLRQAAQVGRQRADESRKRRKEYLVQQREKHKREAEAAGTPHGSPEELLKNYDKNSDGRLSKAEVRGSPLILRFDATDSNKDGLLTVEEIRAAKSLTSKK